MNKQTGKQPAIPFGFNATETAFIASQMKEGDSIQRTVKNLLMELKAIKQANPEGESNEGNRK
ncbi:hypothetical protein ACED47_16970 [Vibrio splendidus]|uniref:hypothetical protein n=1 Tax=Vibrio splendidus TaxID=29497 RepID=UPI00352DFBFA